MEARSPPGPHGGGHTCTAQLLGFTTGLRASQSAEGCASGQMWKFKGNSIGFKAGLMRGCREGKAKEGRTQQSVQRGEGEGGKRTERLGINSLGLPQLENTSLSRTFIHYVSVKKSKSRPSTWVSS